MEHHRCGRKERALELARHEAMAAADAPEAKILKEAATIFSTAAMRLAVLGFGVESSSAVTPSPA